MAELVKTDKVLRWGALLSAVANIIGLPAPRAGLPYRGWSCDYQRPQDPSAPALTLFALQMFGGVVKRYKHDSQTVGCPMHFHVYLPPAAASGKVPVRGRAAAAAGCPAPAKLPQPLAAVQTAPRAVVGVGRLEYCGVPAPRWHTTHPPQIAGCSRASL